MIETPEEIMFDVAYKEPDAIFVIYIKDGQIWTDGTMLNTEAIGAMEIVKQTLLNEGAM